MWFLIIQELPRAPESIGKGSDAHHAGRSAERGGRWRFGCSACRLPGAGPPRARGGRRNDLPQLENVFLRPSDNSVFFLEPQHQTWRPNRCIKLLLMRSAKLAAQHSTYPDISIATRPSLAKVVPRSRGVGGCCSTGCNYIVPSQREKSALLSFSRGKSCESKRVQKQRCEPMHSACDSSESDGDSLLLSRPTANALRSWIRGRRSMVAKSSLTAPPPHSLSNPLVLACPNIKQKTPPGRGG